MQGHVTCRDVTPPQHPPVYVARLTQYLNYASNLSDSEPPCSSACWICATHDALTPLLSAGGGVKPSDHRCEPCETGESRAEVSSPEGAET